MSPDSYLYDVYFRCDSACFYTAGKAWMNGMVPYVDFADSKGPLLWLIYGVGYLLNSHSYVGVFWVSCVFYAVSFTFAYKISRLYIDRRASVLVLALLPVFLFYKRVNDEVRAEDFCNTFIFISLYCLCKVQKGVDKWQMFKYAFFVGVCMTGCLLIKWNVFCMLGGIALVVLFISVKHTKTFTGLWGGLLGIVVAAIPFLVYFAVQGNFVAFITEYFTNTAMTIVSTAYHGDSNIILHYLLRIKCVSLLVILAGVFVFCCRYKGTWGILFSILVFYAGLSPSPFDTYFIVALPFGIFLLIVVCAYVCNKISFPRRALIAICFLCILCSTSVSIHYDRLFDKSVFVSSDKGRQQYYNVSQLMATVRKPKVMFYFMDTSVGVLAEALPACKYWIQQYGASPAMLRVSEADLQKRKPDFIFVGEGDINRFPSVNLERMGYVYLGKHIDCYGTISSYCKKELYRKLPPVKLRTIDLLLKRNLLCKDED